MKTAWQEVLAAGDPNKLKPIVDKGPQSRLQRALRARHCVEWDLAKLGKERHKAYAKASRIDHEIKQAALAAWELQLNQARIAELVGVTQPTVCSWIGDLKEQLRKATRKGSRG